MSRKNGQFGVRLVRELGERDRRLDVLRTMSPALAASKKRKASVTLPRVSIQEDEDLEAHDRWRKT